MRCVTGLTNDRLDKLIVHSIILQSTRLTGVTGLTIPIVTISPLIPDLSLATILNLTGDRFDRCRRLTVQSSTRLKGDS